MIWIGKKLGFIRTKIMSYFFEMSYIHFWDSHEDVRWNCYHIIRFGISNYLSPFFCAIFLCFFLENFWNNDGYFIYIDWISKKWFYCSARINCHKFSIYVALGFMVYLSLYLSIFVLIPIDWFIVFMIYQSAICQLF